MILHQSVKFHSPVSVSDLLNKRERVLCDMLFSVNDLMLFLPVLIFFEGLMEKRGWFIFLIYVALDNRQQLMSLSPWRSQLKNILRLETTEGRSCDKNFDM